MSWKEVESYRGSLFNGEWPTIPEMFSISAKRFPEKLCFTEFSPERNSLTYKETEKIVQTVAGWLIEKGIKPGNKIALIGRNRPEWGIAYLSILYCGAVVVPIDNQLSLTEIEGLIEHSESKLLFVDSDKFDTLETKKLISKVSISDEKDNFIYNLKAKPLKKTIAKNENDLAALLYTSGTTGVAKGVMLTHRNFVSDCYLGQNLIKIGSTDTFYVLLPIHHAYTMLAVFLESLSVGAETVFGKKLAISSILNDLSKGGITVFLGVPILYNKLIRGILKKIRDKGKIPYALVKSMMWISGIFKKYLKLNIGKFIFKGILEKASLSKVRILISGGGPLPSSTFKYYNQLGLNFVQGYGLTETAPILTLNPLEAYKEASVGKVFPQLDMKIIEKDSAGHGEIIVKGPMVMQGYYKSKEETKEAFTNDGYFKTGDIGYLDSDNYLFLTGRAKSVIVTEGGKNVFPEELEHNFQLYDEIEQVLIRGFIKDKKQKTEGIEVLFYPSESMRKENKTEKEVQTHFETVVAEINHNLLPYKRIEKIRLLDKPMEMTSKRTIKRHKISV